MLSAGILAFIFMDVGAGALGLVETHLDAYKDHHATLWPVIGLFAVLSTGFLVGVGGIATIQRRVARGAGNPPAIAGGESTFALSTAEPGHAIEDGEYRRGGHALAPAVRDRTGAAIAAVGVSSFGRPHVDTVSRDFVRSPTG